MKIRADFASLTLSFFRMVVEGRENLKYQDFEWGDMNTLYFVFFPRYRWCFSFFLLFGAHFFRRNFFYLNFFFLAPVDGLFSFSWSIFFSFSYHQSICNTISLATAVSIFCFDELFLVIFFVWLVLKWDGIHIFHVTHTFQSHSPSYGQCLQLNLP